jgi:hypothetical protein
MKLYTEEQVRKAISYARSISADNYENPPIERVLNSITPIELPSDEEIEESSPYVPSNPKIDYLSHQKGFDKGAKWMKEQILQPNL